MTPKPTDRGPRDFGVVVADMLGHIPESDPIGATLHDRLLAFRESAKYTPPEDMGVRWSEAMFALKAAFGSTPPTTGWQKAVYDVWMGTT